MVRSTDSGRTWGAKVTLDNMGQAAYSRSSGEIVMLLEQWQAESTTSRHAPQYARHADTAVAAVLDCAYYLTKYCKAEAGKGTACQDCLNAHPAKFTLCTLAQEASFCKNGTLPFVYTCVRSAALLTCVRRAQPPFFHVHV